MWMMRGEPQIQRFPAGERHDLSVRRNAQSTTSRAKPEELASGPS